MSVFKWIKHLWLKFTGAYDLYEEYPDMAPTREWQTQEKGVATSSGYCYACPDPITKGEVWRREMSTVYSPSSYRLVHDVCPKDRIPTKTDIAMKALVNPDYRQGLIDAAHVARAQGTDPNMPPCPSQMVAVYLDRLANGRLL